MAVQARGAISGINIDDSALFSAEKVDIEDRRNLEPPIKRLEPGIAVEEIERRDEILLDTVLVATAEEIGAVACCVLTRSREAAW